MEEAFPHRPLTCLTFQVRPAHFCGFSGELSNRTARVSGRTAQGKATSPTPDESGLDPSRGKTMPLPAGSDAGCKEMQRRAGRAHIPSILNFARGIAHAMALPQRKGVFSQHGYLGYIGGNPPFFE